MQFISFIANAFLDILTDVQKNIMKSQNKVRIIPKHLLEALQELQLDEFLPFLLEDSSLNYQSLNDICERENNIPSGMRVSQEQALSGTP